MDGLFPGLTGAPNVHPIFVHFPIALLPTALLLWLVAAFGGPRSLWAVGRWLLYLGVLGAAVAVGTGLWASEKMGHDSLGHELIHVHRSWMYATAALAVVTALVAFFRRGATDSASRFVAIGLLAVTSIVMILGADRGAALVFRYGIGTADEPIPEAEGGPTHGEGEGEGHDHGDDGGHAH